MDELRRHDIEIDSPSLIAFLNAGFPESVNVASLPAQPDEKCQLLIYAMQVLGKRGERQAIPPLLALAEGSPPDGVKNMIARDALLAPPATQFNRQRDIVEFLRYNAAVALGLIGDPVALPAVQKLYVASEGVARCRYALCLACLGDPSAIGFLVEEIRKSNQSSSAVAARSLYYIAGIEFGYAPSSPVRLRAKLAQEYVNWWNTQGSTLRPVPTVVIRRWLDPLPRPRLAPDTLRNLVALASDHADFSNARGSRDAAEKLDQMGAALADKLSPLLFDPFEDLIVRREAIRRYADLRQKKSKDTLKKLVKDENPEIADYARELLDAIDRGALGKDPGITTKAQVKPVATKEARR